MKAVIRIYVPGRSGVYDTHSSPEMRSDDDIDEYVEDMCEFLKEQLAIVKEEEGM